MGNKTSSTSSYVQTSENFIFANEPTFPQFQKFLEEDSVANGRKRDVFDLISQIIYNLKKKVSQVFKWIRENKKDMVKDGDLKELVREYINNSLETLKFYNALVKSLRKEKTRQRKIEIVLKNIAPGRPPLSGAKLKKVKETLVEFINTEDPFKDFHRLYKSVLKRHEETRRKLEKKIQELGKKGNAKRVWRLASRIILGAVASVLAVCCVVVIFVAPGEPTVATAISLYTASMGPLAELIFSFLKEKNKITPTMEVMVHKMEKNTSVIVNEMKQIHSRKDGLNSFKGLIVKNVKNYLQNEDVVDLAEIAKDIKEFQQPLMQKLDDLCQDVERCLEELKKQREDIKWA